jgi:ABC-type multidrug transport system fused ATPase/permease subunit
LVVAERLGGVATALAWHTHTFVYWLATLSVLALGHRFLRGYLHRAMTATAFRRIVEAVAESGRDIHLGKGGSVAIVDGVDALSRISIDVAIPFVADLVATAVAIAALVRAGAFPLLAGVAAALAIVLASASFLSRRGEPTFDKYLAVADRIMDALDGRAELLASGAAHAFIDDTQLVVDDWRRAAARSTFGALKAARWSIVVVAAGALFVLLSRGVDWILLKQALLVAVLAPLSLGTVQSAFALSKLAAQMAPLQTLFSDRLDRAATGALSVEGGPIRWEGVTVSLGGRTVLSNLDAEALAGRVIAVAGPNGAGKTTLLLATLALRRLAAGRICIGGVDLTECEPNAWRAHVRYLPQNPYLLPRRTIADAMQFPVRALSRAAMQSALERVELWERLRSRGDPFEVATDSLSAGERQRLALARLLADVSEIYLLDEPDANLDAAGTVMVTRLLRELADHGAVVLFAAHSPQMLDAADEVVRVANGRRV